jgi:hypothetical protein
MRLLILRAHEPLDSANVEAACYPPSLPQHAGRLIQHPYHLLHLVSHWLVLCQHPFPRSFSIWLQVLFVARRSASLLLLHCLLLVGRPLFCFCTDTLSYVNMLFKARRTLPVLQCSACRCRCCLLLVGRPLFCFCHTFYEAVDMLIGDKATPTGVGPLSSATGKDDQAAAFVYTTA